MTADAQREAPVRIGLRTPAFSLLAIALGAVAGAGAYAFRLLIALFHNALLLGRFSIHYDTNVHTPASPWGPFVVLAPALAAVVVVFLVEHFAPEARGHGVPEVMDAIHYNRGRIRPVVAAVKSFASALSIGSGGSVGREGPIIQIGAAFASWVGRVRGVSRWQLITLVAAGGGAGIAATFNTPIGGVLFAAEVLLTEISVRTLVPVALATATATFVGRFLFGDVPAFPIPPIDLSHTTNLVVLPAFAALGVLAALVAAAFIKSLYATEDVLEAKLPNPYVRHVLGMLAVGGLMVALMATTGHYYIQGVGYAAVLDVLDLAQRSIPLIALLLVLKLVATTLTLGSGASGGIFSPSVFMGAMLGGAYALALNLLPGVHVDPAALALAGMAGVVAGTTGAALTAIVMIFEMTLRYSVVLPMTLTVAVAHGLRPLLSKDSIYTLKLTRRGHVIPGALQANDYLVRHVGELAAPASLVPRELPLAKLDLSPDAPAYVLVGDEHELVGGFERAWAHEHRDRLERAGTVAEIATEKCVTVDADASLANVLLALQRADASFAVVRDTEVRGVVTRPQLIKSVVENLTALSD